MIKILLKLILFCLLPALVQAADYTVSTGTSTVDGDTFCGGSACTSSDTIIILGGARGALLLQDFNGSGSYITITNENTNPDSKVEITSNGDPGTGVLSLSNCKYVDLRGNNDADLDYGIKVRDDGSPVRSGTVKVYGESDHIKLSYLETDHIGSTSITGIGIQVQDAGLSHTWTFDTFEIHHNYVHDTRYCGMYLGHNSPWLLGEDNPYCARFSVHDNILKDLGTYGMVLKGLNGGPNSFYNNFVDTTGVVSRVDITDEWRAGIRLRTFTNNYSIEVYNNTVFNTVGPGILAGKGSHNIYDNIVCGCGTGNHVDWGHCIETYLGTTGIHIYDNIIIQPTRYGIYNKGSATNGVTLSRNFIGDAVLGEWAEVSSGNTVESSGADANVYHAGIATFNFNTWSDDSDYSNDRFRTRSLLPVDSGSDTALGTNLTWENFGDITGVDIFFEKDDATPDVKVIDNGNVEIYNPPSDLDYGSTYYWQIVSYGGAETGGVYSFTTTSQANPPILSGGDVKFNKNGASWKFNKNGVSIDF